MNKSQQVLNGLEGLLVREFRASQALYSLTRDERLALSKNDVPSLLRLAEYKESLLDQLGQLEDMRRAALQETSSRLGLIERPPTLAAILAAVDQDLATRLFHMQEGILVLMDQVRDLTRGNRALVTSAIQRADAMQTFLVRLCQLPASQWEKTDVQQLDPRLKLEEIPFYSNPSYEGHDAAHTGDNTVLPAVFAAIIAARDALNADDSTTISMALDDLQSALERLDRFLDLSSDQQWQMQAIVKQAEKMQLSHQSSLTQKRDVNLIEVIADLYHQETAYQAVLKASDRALAIA